MKQKKPLGFYCCYRLKGCDLSDVRTMLVIHYSQKEAGEMFNKFAELKGFQNDIEIATIQKTRKTKRNERVFTDEYIAREEALIKQLENLKRN